MFVAMSGGVDSSVAAAILRERGHDVVGVWMRLVRDGGDADAPRCCGNDEAGADARRAAAHLGIPFYALDHSDVFGRDVVDRFVAAYASGETPNPCVSCNAHVKFEALLGDAIAKFGASYLATGHYARVVRGADGAHRLLRARAAEKDQSYALYMLGPAQLARLLMPIGELVSKEEAREIAARVGLPNATKPDSMDICFAPRGHEQVLRERAPHAFTPGSVERADGTVIGTHRGIATLTVGQRSGVGVAAGERLYVLRLEPERNAAVVGTRAEISAREHRLRDVRATAGALPDRFRTTVALRYRGELLGADVHVRGSEASLLLDEPALVAPGQAAVFYRGDEVVGGGVVTRAA